MAGKKIGLGMLAMVLIFGVTGIAYADGGGTFTLTNIPARFNGMYAILDAEGRNVELFGAQRINNWDTRNVEWIGSRISNGRVSIPMWIENRVGSLSGYNGNHTNLDVFIVIMDSASEFDADEIAEIEFDAVNFSNGSARRSFHDAYCFDEWW